MSRASSVAPNVRGIPREPAVPGVQPHVRDAKAQPGERLLEILQQGRLSCSMRSDDRGAIAEAFESRQ